MELKKIYESLLKEYGPVSDAPMGPPGAPPGPQATPPGPGAVGDVVSDGSDIIELPEIQMIVSLFPAEKKLVFSAQDHTSMPLKAKRYIDILHQNFRITDVRSLSDSSFEVELDPREDFQSIVNFLSPQDQF